LQENPKMENFIQSIKNPSEFGGKPFHFGDEASNHNLCPSLGRP